jgi:hypothetical protein
MGLLTCSQSESAHSHLAPAVVDRCDKSISHHSQTSSRVVPKKCDHVSSLMTINNTKAQPMAAN